MKNILIIIFLLISISKIEAQNRMTPEGAAAEILNNLNNKEFKKVTELFDDNIASKISEEKLSQIYASLLDKFGAFKSKTSSPSRRQMDGSIVVDQLCEFENMSLNFRVKFNETNKISGLQFLPPTPKLSYKIPNYARQDSILEKDIKISSGEYQLPGVLTLPKVGTHFPIVILVHGSGPNDKDESIGPNKIFKDIAYGLSAQGIAVLRYDKRTLVYSEQMKEMQDKLTVDEETTIDVKAAIAFAKSIKEIDSKKIFIIGHSLGGMLTPKIAMENPEIAGAIIMAGNARPLPDLVIDQTNYLMHMDEFTSDDQKNLNVVKKQCELAKSNLLNVKTSTDSLPLQTPAAYWLNLQNYNQTTVASKIKTPLFILQGKRDYQVTTKEFDLWKIALKGKKNVSFQLYDKLNHLFFEGQGELSIPKEYEEQHNVASYVIDDIATFIFNNKK